MKAAVGYTERNHDTLEIDQKYMDFFSEAVFINCEDIIVAANDKAEKLIGAKNSSEIIGKQIKSVIKLYPDYKEVNLGLCISPVKQKIVVGDEIVLDVIIAAFPHIYEGKAAIMLIINDITEKLAIEKKLKETEESLDESERYCEKIVELSPYAIIAHQGSKIVYANKAAGELVAIANHKDMIGRDGSDFMKIHPDYREQSFEVMRQIQVPEMNHVFMEQKLIRNDGTVIDAEVSAAPFSRSGKLHVLLVARDITQRKQMEESERQLERALEYDRLKTEFFANLSHELKTPLNIILGAIQLMDLKDNESRYLKYTSIMKQNCFRLLRLINNLIDITRLDAGFLKMNFRNRNIVEVIENITMSVVDYVESKGLHITFDTDTEEIITACDPDKIERVMLNLLSNAIKFTPAGGEIYVTVSRDKEGFVILIRDTGIGIPKDMHEKVFERFRQVDQLFTRSKEGSGIGLSLVKSIVEAHGGKIGVSSELGAGSMFTIEIPVRRLEIEEEAALDTEFTRQDKVERINIEFSDIYS